MTEDGLTELAMMFKERNKKELLGVCTGMVISELPNVVIRINEFILIYQEELVFASRLLNGTIKVGDVVIVIPSEDLKTYYVVDKAVTV